MWVNRKYSQVHRVNRYLVAVPGPSAKLLVFPGATAVTPQVNSEVARGLLAAAHLYTSAMHLSDCQFSNG